VEFSLTDEEFGELGAASARAGLARGAYAAEAALSVARGVTGPADALFREALDEFVRAAGLVRRIGVNLNQAVAKLNATGQRSGDLVSVRRGEHPPGGTPRRGSGGNPQEAPVIAKISDPRGERVTGLIYYLFGPGRHQEHTDPHLVAGWRHPAELEPPLRADGRRDFRRLNGLLQQPHAALGPRGFERPLWHCAVRAAPEDRMLSDDEWAQIATDIMHRTGLAPHGQDDDAVRWVAVRHGGDHIHLVAMLARQDGGKARLSNERYRVREACRAAEERYELRRTAPGDRTAARRPTRAEQEKTRRRGWEEAPRITLRRAVGLAAAGAASEREFFARLADAGVLVRKRFSTRNPGEVTGYAVALQDDTIRGGPVWFGGGKLAADLTLPRLRRRWEPARATPGERFTPEERNAIWEHAAHAADDASAHIRSFAATNPADAADAAWAAADTLHVAASALGSRVLRQAADAYDRAARPPTAASRGPLPPGTACAAPPGSCPPRRSPATRVMPR